MKKVRTGTFETNSSSTHSITICKESDYNKFENGELYLAINDGRLVTLEEALEIVLEEGGDNSQIVATVNKIKDGESINEDIDESIDEFLSEYCIYSIDKWNYCCECYDTYEKHYTTEGGEEIVAFGYYGNDY